jgi:tetratricopeptide (TPR) repeat protein
MLAHYPDDARNFLNLALISYTLGCLRQATNRPREAADDFHQALALFERCVAKQPGVPMYQSDFARALANCPAPQFRDAPRAVQLAKKALQSRPSSSNDWGVLGSALYRTGAWTDAIEALKKAIELGKGGDAFDWYLLAMAHWRKGDPKEARKCYDKAVSSPDSDPVPNQRLRAEAAVLIGLAEQPKAKLDPQGKR